MSAIWCHPPTHVCRCNHCSVAAVHVVIIVLSGFVHQSLCGCYSYHCHTHTVPPLDWFCHVSGIEQEHVSLQSNGGVKICSACHDLPSNSQCDCLVSKLLSQFGLIGLDPMSIWFLTFLFKSSVSSVGKAHMFGCSPLLLTHSCQNFCLSCQELPTPD